MTFAPEAAAPSPAHLPTTRSGARPIAFGLAVGGLSVAAYLGAGLARLAGSVAVPVASITALLLVAATPLLRRLARWAGAPRPELCATWSVLGALPLLLLGARIALGNDAVIASHWRCGSGDIGFMLLSPIAFLLLGSLGGLLAFVLTSSSSKRPGAGVGLRLLSRGALLLGMILVGAAALRALHKPSTDNTTWYLSSLPTVAVLPQPPRQAQATVQVPGVAPPEHEFEDETRIGDIVAHRTCDKDACRITLRRAGAPPPPERMVLDSTSSSAGAPLSVQRDEEHGFWIVGGNRAFSDRDLRLTDIYAQDISDELSAPRGWILGGAAGLLVAVALWARSRRLGQRLLGIEAAQAGTLGENGWITFDDDTAARRASPDLALAAGPVLLMRQGTSGGPAGAYRTEGTRSGDEIVAGTRRDLVAGLRARMAGLDALGLVAVLLTAAPLLASWTVGLVFGGW